MKVKLIVILPAYNEEESLPSLLKRWDLIINEYNLNAHIILINDGSVDNTPNIAKEFKSNYPIKVVDVYPNKGLANAIREGFQQALQVAKEQDIITLMDADDTHNPGLIIRMINTIHEGADIVIASRYRDGSRIYGLSGIRKFLSWGSSILFRMFVSIKGVRDYTCGYRAYRALLLKKAMTYYNDKFIEQKGFAAMSEILIKLKPFHPIVIEVPFILRYDHKKGASKMKVFQLILQTLKMLISKK